MQWILDWHGRATGGTTATAQRSQALVIEAVDRLVRLTGDRGTVNRALNMQLDVMEAVLGDPPRLLEQSYDALQHLVALHREFAHRLLESFDHRDDARIADLTAHDHLATVHPLRTGGRRA